jgi:hypothetical protein
MRAGVLSLALALSVGCSRRTSRPEEPSAAASGEANAPDAPIAPIAQAAPVAPPVWTGSVGPGVAPTPTPTPAAAERGSADAAPVAAPEGDVPADARIALHRTACFGSCPAYRVELRGDGRVVFEGESSVRVAHAERRIPREAAEKIFRSLGRIGFWGWKASYRQPITDHSSAVVEAAWGASVKSVEEYPECTSESGAPPALCALGKAIDDAAHTAEWTTCKNAGGRVVPCPPTPGGDRKPSAGCDPPYTFDAKGVKHYKPQCLER